MGNSSVTFQTGAAARARRRPIESSEQATAARLLPGRRRNPLRRYVTLRYGTARDPNEIRKKETGEHERSAAAMAEEIGVAYSILT